MIMDAKEAAARGFERALQAGDALLPSALKQVLGALHAGESYELDLNKMADGIRIELPYVEALHRGYAKNEELHEAWVTAVRGILNCIKYWGQDGHSNHLEALRALVTAAFVLDIQLEGLTQVASSIVTEQVRAGLEQLVSQYVFRPMFNDGRYRLAHEDARNFAHENKFEYLLPRFHHLFFGPGGDISAIVILLFSSFPEILARAIEVHDDINFSGVVNDVLDQKALRFSLDVHNIGFKFACVATFSRENRNKAPGGSDVLLSAILQQVAEHSEESWRSWAKAFFQYPGGYPLLEEALALALAAMSEQHWSVILKAPALSRAPKSDRPFAQLVLNFRKAAGEERFIQMCRLAFDIWQEWDYRDEDSQSHMYSAQTCAYDFPVSAYYACQETESLTSEVNRLQQSIDSIEEQWFDSSMHLTDQRSRLLSRLRLVRHGLALQNGCLDALPPEFTSEPHPYFAARFPYSALRK